jgi:hypothetical protein
MDIGKILKNGWELFVRDIGPLIVGALIAGVLSVLSLLILAGPLFGGLYLMIVRRIREGRPAEFGDVFACFDRFGTLFLAFWGGGLLILLGLALLVVPGLLLITIWVYMFPLVVDKGLSVGEAMSRSKEMVMKGGFWMHFAALLVVCVLTIVASIVTSGVGNLLTVPFFIAFVVAMYFVALGEGDLVDAAGGTVVPVPAGSAAPVGGLTAPASPSPPSAAAVPVPGAAVPSAADVAAPSDTTAAAPEPAAVSPVHTDSPAVDEHGHLEAHCTQCGATMDASSEFCSICAAEVSGGHGAEFVPPSISKGTGLPGTKGEDSAED